MSKIIIKNVTKIIKKNPVISNLSMEIPEKSIIGLQGVNGSGKTMLLRLISGLIYPTTGEVTVDGHVLGSKYPFPKSLGLLIENPAFLDSYSGFQNLMMLANLEGQKDPQDIKELIEKVGLADQMSKKYKKYSLGMKQRLGIAAALLDDPDLILLDEPTNALDRSGIAMVKAIIKEQKEKGATIIIASHDDSFLHEVADHIYYLENGELVI